MTYTGATCPVCGQKFTDQDDVVVCPDCGTPYHRSCYKEKGRCIMDDLHAQGKEWENPIKPKEQAVRQETIRVCPVCGHPNQANAENCENCGRPLLPGSMPPPSSYGTSEDPRQAALNAAFGQIDPNSTIQKVSVRDVIAFTQKNANYFVRLFKLLSSEISAMVFNWSALLFGPFYFLYRKMYRQGFTMLLMDLASYLPSFAVAYHLMPQALADPSLLQTMTFNTSGLEGLISIANLVGYIPFILHLYCGFTANKKYFKHSMNTLQQISRQYSGNRMEMERQIMRAGGVNPVAVFLAVLGVFLLFAAISAIITITLLP